MAALTAGKIAPDFTLHLMDGSTFSLREALRRGPVVLAFFKVSCPVCQFAFPYVERLFQGYRGKNVTVIGVSQNGKKDTAAFAREYGISFPIALDDTKSYPVSNAYGLTNVPTVFHIAPDGTIAQSIVAWARDEMQQLAQDLAVAMSEPPAAVFKPGENVPEFKAG
jgi:peroxiredoxin